MRAPNEWGSIRVLQLVAFGPQDILVQEVAHRYNGGWVDHLADGFIRALEGKDLVRMLVDQVEPVAEGGVALAAVPQDAATPALVLDQPCSESPQDRGKERR